MKTKNKIVYYGAEGQLQLDDTPEDAVLNRDIDNMELFPIVVYKYAPVVPQLDPKRILEDTLELLDEEYGDIDGDGTHPTEKMKKAAEDFCAAILSEYTSSMLEHIGIYKKYSKEEALNIHKKSKRKNA